MLPCWTRKFHLSEARALLSWLIMTRDSLSGMIALDLVLRYRCTSCALLLGSGKAAALGDAGVGSRAGGCRTARLPQPEQEGEGSKTRGNKKG